MAKAVQSKSRTRAKSQTPPAPAPAPAPAPVPVPVRAKRVGQAKALTERDYQILRWVGQGGVASLGQLHARYWSEAKERTAQERLQQLVNAGYLMLGQTDYRLRGETIYGLTRKGAGEFGKLEAHRLIVGLPNRAEMKQQLYAQDTRSRLERELAERGAKLVDWRNERELRSKQSREKVATANAAKNKRPRAVAPSFSASSSQDRPQFEDITDAQAVIEEADGSTSELDIEIDGAYFGKMLQKKLTDLARTGRPILWVSAGAGRARRIERDIQQAGIQNIEVVCI